MNRAWRGRSIASYLPQLLCLSAIVFVAVSLRAYKLDAQSLWYDEGNSARIAERSLQLILAGAAADIHPPLYYLALHYWRMVFGDSEAGLRLLSVVCGTLLVVVTYGTARTLFGVRTAFIAAAMTAFSPLAVYYSQEARMYILLALEASLSTWALFEILGYGLPVQHAGSFRAEHDGHLRMSRILLYVFATASGLYTQYAYPFVMIAQGLCVVLWLALARSRRARVMTVYAIMNVVAIAVYVPWLPIAIRQVTSWTVAAQEYELGPAMLDALRWIVVGRTLPLEQAGLALLLLGILLAIVACSIFRAITRHARRNGNAPAPTKEWQSDVLAKLSLLLLLVVPFALLFVFKLYRESYLKILLVCVSPLCILAAQGVCQYQDALHAVFAKRSTNGTASPIIASLVMTALVIITQLPSLDNLYNNPAYARDDYRSIARSIDANARPGDAILFDAPNQWEVFTYYHHDATGAGGGAPAIPLAYRPASDAVVDAQLRPISQQYMRLFVLYYGERESDPQGIIERWLGLHAFQADEQWVGNIRLAVYATQSPIRIQAIAARFGDAIDLTAVAVDLEPRRAGDLIPLQLTWHAEKQVNLRYTVFVHIGLADAPPVAQNDAEPGAGYSPTSAWNVGADVVDRRAVWLKPSAAPGRYGLYIGMYDNITGQRLLVTRDGQPAGDRLWLGDIDISTGP